MKKIEIMGCGYIGLPTAITFTLAGYEVCGFDVKDTVVDTLNAGHIHIVEPGLQDAMTKAMATGRLHFTTKPEPADVFIICVQTPYRETEEHKRVSDMRFVESAAKEVGSVLRAGNLCVLESTSPPYSTRMVEKIVSETSGLAPEQFMTAHCPERIIPGRMLIELRENDRIIGSNRPESAQFAKEIYEKVVTGGTIRLTDDLTAEMCKLTENSFRDVNIAFANELSLICADQGINVWELIRLANRHPRVNILQPGPGVGGHCIAVDPWFIVAQNPQQARLIRTAREVNDHKPEWVIEQVKAQVADCLNATNKRASELTIACFGLAFKPNIDDLRESPAMEIAAQIARWHSGTTQVVEPNIHALPKKLDGLCTLATLEAALASADVLVMLVDHNQFKAVSGDSVTQAFIVDTKGVWR